MTIPATQLTPLQTTYVLQAIDAQITRLTQRTTTSTNNKERMQLMIQVAELRLARTLLEKS